MIAETMIMVLILFVSRALFIILQCPNCKTFKSTYSQKKKKGTDEDGKEQITCKVCNHSWKRLPFEHVGGGGDGGFS